VRDFGGKTPEAEAHTIIDYALDAGINVIDTANIYERGQSEAVIGPALKSNGKRSKVVLTTKVWGRIDCICAPGKTLVSYYYEDSSADFRPSQYRW